ncbi:acetyl-CoA synthetase-like protein [Lentinus tigrinus ALCF2SS1-7]|uniref:Acetyl-CoA synthetase-like protein n=1 Tax=Lentinus tigrinus ALCF2SS1-6 TaxID=1328759 RepID=A0A5C2SRJ6_9APHY|nr:acetyl-CoA synthetase-like protein [Lentinus tigrinus ALCF2SS1-6]RPD79905.1 acetyl-CoA synthetase-like protein [Lentinus tigrinus ALCF2SS1-7]
MALSDYLVTDDLTIILALVAAGLFLLHNLYKPQALVHPILLGRQSDVARVRNPSESAVYRNYSTGMLGRFPVRPTKDQQVLLDLVKPDADAPRTLWSTKITNPQLRERIANFGAGLAKVAGLVPQESNVLLLLNDGIEFIISDLALASHLIPSFTLSSLSLLSPVLESHPPSLIITEAAFLPHLLELIYDSNESEHHTIVVVGDVAMANLPQVQNKILHWDDIERQGAALDKSVLPAPEPSDVFTVSFFETPSGGHDGVQLTHENMTAGVAATRALVPPSSALSPLDTIVSTYSLSTPYGRAIAYTALFEGTGFATVDSTKLIKPEGAPTFMGLKDLRTSASYRISSPTVLFVHSHHLNSLTNTILQEAQKASWLLYNFAWRHKLAGILEGYMTKQSLWDRLVFDGARVKVMGKGAGTVRAVAVSGGPFEAQALTPSRIALSVPVINVHSHPLAAGPVFASHAQDLQTFPPTPVSSSAASAADAYAFTYLAPVGPPTVNVEVKLTGVDDTAVEAGADPVGALHMRGPSIGRPLSVEEEAAEEDQRGWRFTGERAKVAPNGTFKVVAAGKA